jgi:hypothetical protein
LQGLAEARWRVRMPKSAMMMVAMAMLMIVLVTMTVRVVMIVMCLVGMIVGHAGLSRATAFLT